PLGGERPDLPGSLCTVVDALLSVDPARRPQARRAATLLREAFAERSMRVRPAVSRRVLLERAAHAGLAAALAGAVAQIVPFFPSGWPFVLAGVCALTALRS